MILVKCLCLLATLISKAKATTHWMVTENGLIQPRLDSPFQLANLYDLLVFLNQDLRWGSIKETYKILEKQQNVIDNLWRALEDATNVGMHVDNQESCRHIESLTGIDWYTFIQEDGSSKVSADEYQIKNPMFKENTDVPDCKKISSLTFSMAAFDHLDSVANRDNLTIKRELTLPDQISPIMTVDQFGHWLSVTLRRNSSSWLHYNLASLYWRVRGNAPKALECSRRAVHYAPRVYKDIALLNMGTIFLRSRMVQDAITVLVAAVDHDPYQPSSHFFLANAYAVVGDYNSSLEHYKICLKLNPDFNLVLKYRLGVECHMDLLRAIDMASKILKNVRVELAMYHSTEVQWVKDQTSFLSALQHDGYEFDFRNVEANCDKISELTGLNVRQIKNNGDKFTLMQYYFGSPMYKDMWLNESGVHAVEATYSIHTLIKHINKHTENPSEYILKQEFEDLKVFDTKHRDLSQVPIKSNKIRGKRFESSQLYHNDNNKIYQYEKGDVLYPSTMKINRNVEDFDIESDWPSTALCKDSAPIFYDKFEAIFPVFLPFENKGLSIKSLLTHKIGVPPSTEHDLPWYPPNCPQDKDTATFTAKKGQKPQITKEVINANYLRQKLLEYAGDGDASVVKHMQDAEIGHRIYTAMEKKLAPKWLLYTLSSLYWRVRSNNANALNCLLSANRSVQARYKDVVLTSLASVYLEMGFFEDALLAAEEAFKLSIYEPATNFILAELNMIKKHRNTHMYHLKQVIRVEPNFMNGLARELVNEWACAFKLLYEFQNIDRGGDGDVCTQVKSGMNLVCEKDGVNCHMTSIHCFSNEDKGESVLLRNLESKETEEPAAPNSADDVDVNIFNSFIENMPKKMSDIQAHEKNFDALMAMVKKVWKGCGSRGCSELHPEDLSMKEDDCLHQHLQLGYWLHIISFRQIITDSEDNLPSEIIGLHTTTKKTPECRVISSPSEDFVLNRINKMSTERWEPVLSLMHQLAEWFDFFDYVSMGTKIAKYLEMKPSSWQTALLAAWWCGAGGRGACALQCLSAAYSLAPKHLNVQPLRTLTALLLIQGMQEEGKNIAYLSFYLAPKSKIEAFLVGVSHTNLMEFEPAVWMYRYSLSFDENFLPAKVCLHANMCLMFYGGEIKS